MNRMRTIHLMIIALLISSMVIPTIASAQQMLPVYFFWGEGCPHCEEEKVVLEKWEEQYAIRVYSLEVWNNRDNAALLQQAANALQTNVGGVPFTVIGDQPFTGFSRSAMVPAMTARIKSVWKPPVPIRWHHSSRAMPLPCAMQRNRHLSIHS
jgi:thiol-disulfide isomerase/thioredoxin